MSDIVKIIIADQTIEGTYAVDGFYLTVRSAYGLRRINLGLLKPDRAARLLLRRIVEEATRDASAPTAAEREIETRVH